MKVQEIGWGAVDWIEMAQDKEKWWAFVNRLMKLSVSIKRKEYRERLRVTRISSSRRTWSHPWSVVCRSKGRVPSGMFCSRVLRRIVAPDTERVAGIWIHNKTLHNWCLSQNIVNQDGMGETCNIYIYNRRECRISVEMPYGKRYIQRMYIERWY